MHPLISSSAALLLAPPLLPFPVLSLAFSALSISLHPLVLSFFLLPFLTLSYALSLKEESIW